MSLIYTSFRLEPLDCCPRHCVSTLWYFCCEQQKCHEPLIKWAAMRMQQSEGRKWDNVGHVGHVGHVAFSHVARLLSSAKLVSHCLCNVPQPETTTLRSPLNCGWCDSTPRLAPPLTERLRVEPAASAEQHQSHQSRQKSSNTQAIHPTPTGSRIAWSYNESYTSIYGQHL